MNSLCISVRSILNWIVTENKGTFFCLVGWDRINNLEKQCLQTTKHYLHDSVLVPFLVHVSVRLAATSRAARGVFVLEGHRNVSLQKLKK